MIIDLTDRYKLPSYWWRGKRDNPGDVKHIAIHYSYTTMPATATQAEEIAHLDAIHRGHLERGLGGFGYNGAAFASGRIYLCTPLDRWGAHVEDGNADSLGFVGIFRHSGPPALAIREGLAELVAAGDAYVGAAVPVLGHRQFPDQSTSCPGANYALWVPNLREVLMTSPLDTKVPQPTTAGYLPFSAKLPTSFGGKWPAWSLLKYVHYGFLLIRRLQNKIKTLQDTKLSWASTRQVPAQTNGAPKRGPHSIAVWLIYLYRWNWDRRKEHTALKARVFTLETKLAALDGTGIAKEEAVKAVGEKLLS